MGQCVQNAGSLILLVLAVQSSTCLAHEQVSGGYGRQHRFGYRVKRPGSSEGLQRYSFEHHHHHQAHHHAEQKDSGTTPLAASSNVEPLPAVERVEGFTSIGHQHPSLPADPEQLDVWIVAGQSNAVGNNQLDKQQMPSPCADPISGRMLMFPVATRIWTDARRCVGQISMGVNVDNAIGPEMPFGRALLDTLKLSHKVGFVPTAVPGTGLYNNWLPPHGEQWRNMINATHDAMAAYGPKARLRGMLWVQGEMDAFFLVGGHASPNYTANMHKLLDDTRAALQQYHPMLPVIMALMSTQNRQASFPFIYVVRQAQLNVDRPSVIRTDMEGLEHFFEDDGQGQQWVHLSKNGACTLGTNMAVAYSQSGIE